MVVPWIGFELNHIIKLAEPTYKAKFVAFESVYDPENLPGKKRNILEAIFFNRGSRESRFINSRI